ncbi:MAG: protease inhibitor I42 family protein [Aminivibrio sp.]
MRLKIVFCLLIVMFISGIAGSATGADFILRGTVLDEGQKGLPGVAVSIWDGKIVYRGMTDFDGNFTIRGLTPGKPFAIRWTPVGGASVKVDALTFPAEGDLYLSMDFASVGRPNVYTVRLPSNPSTGYGWRALHPGTAVVKLKENVFVEEEESFPAKEATGLPGAELWRYQAAAKGKTALIFGYSRPWEKETTSAKYHVVSMTVR